MYLLYYSLPYSMFWTRFERQFYNRLLERLGLRARTSLIRDSLWFAFDSKSNQKMIRQWVNHDSPTIDFWFDLILIRRWIMIRGWIKIRDESKSNRIKMNKINLNRKSKWIKIKMNCESKWINIRIKSNKIHIFLWSSEKFSWIKKGF